MDKLDLKYLSIKDCEKILNRNCKKYSLEKVELVRSVLSEFISIILESEQ